MTRPISGRAARGATVTASPASPSGDPPASGENRLAAERTLAELERIGRLEAVDAARVQMIRSMADSLDARPNNSQMWHEYRETVEGLIASGDDGAEIDAVLARLRAPVHDEA